MLYNSRMTTVSPPREAPSGNSCEETDDNVPEVVSAEPRDPTSGTAITADKQGVTVAHLHACFFAIFSRGPGSAAVYDLAWVPRFYVCRFSMCVIISHTRAS